MNRPFQAHVRVCATTDDPMGDASPREAPSPGPASPTPGPSTSTATKTSRPVAAGNPTSIDLPASVPSLTTIDLDFDTVLLDIDVPPLATSDSHVGPVEIGSLDDFIDFASLDKVMD